MKKSCCYNTHNLIRKIKRFDGAIISSFTSIITLTSYSHTMAVAKASIYTTFCHALSCVDFLSLRNSTYTLYTLFSFKLINIHHWITIFPSFTSLNYSQYKILSDPCSPSHLWQQHCTFVSLFSFQNCHNVLTMPWYQISSSHMQ